MEMLKPLAALIAEHGPFRLLIVDSIIALFRVDYLVRARATPALLHPLSMALADDARMLTHTHTTTPQHNPQPPPQGRGELSERQQRLGQHLSELVRVCLCSWLCPCSWLLIVYVCLC